ncbi:DrmB family protein [Bacillus sp. S10(2024)]|uniref:DrmB family protein n=1 Tax=Bacillus sp. S10(2024) TaxID=3162886 RepID=UPI003D1F1A34
MKNEVGEVRPGQLVTTYGPGAIMDSVNDSIMVLDINYWSNATDIIYDKRLAEFLRKDYFKKISDKGKFDLPSIPFPNYHVCSNNKCRRLFDIRENFIMSEYLKKGPTCPDCRYKAYPSRFVVSCSNNHLDDFPWRWWAHGKKPVICNGKLYMTSSGNSSSLDSMGVKCECGAPWQSMKGAMSEKVFEELKCTGNHPHRLNERKNCGVMGIIPLQRGASNVYFPALRSAISMPDKDEELAQFFYSYEQRIREYDEDWGHEGLVKFYNRNLEDSPLFLSLDDFVEKWYKYRDRDKQDINKYEQIKEIEYESLTNFTEYTRKGDFEAEEEEVPTDLKQYFSKIVKVHRLKEILVLLGFMRNESPEPEVRELPNIVWLGGDTKTNWLPAVEVYGEGIFIEFNQEIINQWLKENSIVRKRSLDYQSLYREWVENKGWSNQNNRNAVYVMLHTFSHLLMKQLSHESGYSSTAIKERIYCGNEMAGILIYTGSTDQEGSLGGLVEMGNIPKLRKIIVSALEEAIFCSGDPDCATQEPNEESQLNGAACHACTMLAETSCETGNRLLDRSLVVRVMDSEIKPFFKVEELV